MKTFLVEKIVEVVEIFLRKNINRALLKLLQQIFFKNEATQSLTRETKEVNMWLIHKFKNYSIQFNINLKFKDTFNREMRISDKEADKENMSVPCLLSAPHSLLM